MARTKARPTAVPVRDAIKVCVRARREERRLTRDELAEIVRRYGISWDENTVTAVEHGAREIDFEEWAVLLRVFEVDEAGFFEGVPLLSVGVIEVEPGGLFEVSGRIDLNVLLQEDEVREAERSAAATLGITVPVLKKRSRLLWAKSLTQERDKRVGAREQERDEPLSVRSRQAIRGHVTRSLLEELRAAETKGSKPTTKKGGTR